MGADERCSYPEHRLAQRVERAGLFEHYRLRVARVLRDYGLDDRRAAAADAAVIEGRKRS